MNHLSLLPDDVQYLIYRHVFSGVMNELQEFAALEPDPAIALHLNLLFRSDERIWDGKWFYAEE